jgi:hypothetical protein
MSLIINRTGNFQQVIHRKGTFDILGKTSFQVKKIITMGVRQCNKYLARHRLLDSALPCVIISGFPNGSSVFILSKGVHEKNTDQ